MWLERTTPTQVKPDEGNVVEELQKEMDQVEHQEEPEKTLKDRGL